MNIYKKEMSFVYMCLGGCAAVGGVYFVGSKMLSYIYGLPAASPPGPRRSLAEASQGGNESEAEQAKRLEKQLSELHASLASLNTQYMEKYGVKPADRIAVKETHVTPLSSKKRGSKSSKKSCPNSASSSDDTRKASTVIEKSKRKCTETYPGGSSTVYTDAENLPHSYGFSEDEGSVLKDPIIGKSEVEPKEKVKKWLASNTANHLTDINSSHRGKSNFPKPIAMTIPAYDSPKRWTAVDRDPYEGCETYVASTPRRESPKKNAPHLYKRLNLRKKSISGVEDSKPSTSKSRKSEEGNDKVPNTRRDKSQASDVHKKNFRSEPDRKKRKRVAENEGVDLQDVNDIDPSTELAGCDSDGSDSDTIVNSNAELSDECASNTNHKAHSEGKLAVVGRRNRHATPSQPSFPQPAEKLTCAEKNSQPSSAKVIQSQTQLKKKIDEVLDMKPEPFAKTKSSPMVNKRSEQSTGLSEARRIASKNQFDSGSDDEMIWTTKTKSSAAKRERKSNATAMRKTSSNRERLGSYDPESCEENVSDRKKAFAVNNKIKSSFSSRERPSNNGTEMARRLTNSVEMGKKIEDKVRQKSSGSRERPKTVENASLFSVRSMNQKSKEFLGKYRLRVATDEQRPKTSGKVDLAKKVSPFEKRKEFQAKYQMKERQSPKLEEKEVKSNQFAKRKEFGAKFHMRGGRDPHEEVVSPKKMSPFDKRKEFQAKYHMKEHSGSGSRNLEENDIKSRHSEKRKEFGAKLQLRVGQDPPEEVDVPKKVNPFDKRKEFQAKYHMKLPNEQPIKSTATVVMDVQSRSDRRKEALSQYKNKYLPRRTCPEREGTSPKISPTGSKVREPAKCSRSTSRTRPGKDEAGGKAEKSSPLRRRMEYDAKCRKKSSGLFRRKSSINDDLEAEKEFKTPCRVKSADSTTDRPSPRTASTGNQSDLSDAPEEFPTMNRQPSDRTRKTYLFDWDSKCYAVANEPDVVPQGSSLRKPRGSSIPPPKGKSLPAPRGMKRPLSAELRTRTGSSQDSRTRTDVSLKNKKIFGMDSDDENSSVDERSLVGKSSSQWGSNLSSTSCDFEFDAKGLSESNMSSGVNSEVSEETMVKELTNSVSARRCIGNDSEEEGGKEEATKGEFLFPVRSPDLWANESTSGPRLQDILDLPASVSGARESGHRMSRSAGGGSSDDEDDPSRHVFTGSRALRKSKKGLFTRRSSVEIAVLTRGFRRMAMEEKDRLSRESD